MSTESFAYLSRGDMFRYSRSTPALVRDQDGVESLSPPNVVRMNYSDDGRFLGIKFGDGDSASIPNIINPIWKNGSEGGTIVALGQAPNGVSWLRIGDVEISGVLAHKLSIIHLSRAEVDDLPISFSVFPEESHEENDSCHLMLVKYYNTQIDFTPHTEYEAMEELNTFMHGDWS